jgi:hypothetical protein
MAAILLSPRVSLRVVGFAPSGAMLKPPASRRRSIVGISFSTVSGASHCFTLLKLRAWNGSTGPPVDSHTPWPEPKLTNADLFQYSTVAVNG